MLGRSPRGNAARLQYQDLRPRSQLSSIKASGTRVVLPAPGGATRTADVCAAKVVFNSSRTASIGSGVANFMGCFHWPRSYRKHNLRWSSSLRRIKDEVWTGEVTGRHRALETIAPLSHDPIVNPSRKRRELSVCTILIEEK